MNKEKFFLVIASFLFCFTILSIPAGAYIYQRSTYAAKYVMTASVQEEENAATVVQATTTAADVSAGTRAGIHLVDVSNTNMFPQPWSGEARISQIDIEWTAFAPATTTWLIGTIASTSPTTGVADVNYFASVTFVSDPNDSSTYSQHRTLDYSASLMKLGHKQTSTTQAYANNHYATSTGFVSNIQSTRSDSTFATGTAAVWSPLGSRSSYYGVGDLVAKLYYYSGAVSTTTITTLYHVK